MTDSSSTRLSLHNADTLRRTAKWGRFLSILGLLGSSVMGLASFVSWIIWSTRASRGSENSGLDQLTSYYLWIFMILGVVCFLSSLFLYQFAKSTLRALGPSFDERTLNRGLEALLHLFQFIGIIFIISLGFQVLAFLVVLMKG